MVVKLDKIDREIMYELDKNARATYQEIAKNIKSKKDVVSYRFNRLMENSIIKKFVTVFALGKVHIFNFKIYFQFQGLSESEEKRMLQDFIEDAQVIWVAKCEGRWDLMTSHYARHVKEFAKIKDRIFEKYGKYVQDYSIIINDEAWILNRDYLVLNKPLQRKSHVYIGEVEDITINEIDKRLFHLISNNARFHILDIAKKLNLDVKTVKQKIKKYEELGFIEGYTTFFNLNSIGLKFFKIFIYAQEQSKKEYNSLFEFCRNRVNVIHLIKTLGPWELELEIEAENIDYIHKLTKELRNRFPNIIKKIESVIISDELKLDFFPQNF